MHPGSAHAGKQNVANNSASNYKDWKLAASKNFDALTVKLPYTDTNVENAILLHRPDGEVMKFTPSATGLYKYNIGQGNVQEWNMVQTVAKQADKYTKCAYKKAVLARRLQNIMMRPGARELMDVTIKHLRDCPVTRADVQAAEDIFGTNVGSLKGKTPTHPNEATGALVDYQGPRGGLGLR